MIRLKQSEVLWLLRGVRFGKFLRRCADPFHRRLEKLSSEADGSVPEANEEKISSRRGGFAEGFVTETNLRKERREGLAAGGEGRLHRSIPAAYAAGATATAPHAAPPGR